MENLKHFSTLSSHQEGSATMIAAASLVMVGAALIFSQMTTSKADTAAVSAAVTAETGAQQAAALAAAEGVSYVNSLGTWGVNQLCTSGTGCSTGVYGSSALSGNAIGQAASWWTASNAHTASPYNGLNTNPLYAVELVSCDNTGLATYRVTGHAVSNSTAGIQGSSISNYIKTVTRNWGVSGTTTGVFINQLSNGWNVGTSGQSKNLGTTVTLNQNATGSTINFTAGSTGFINKVDVLVDMRHNAGYNCGIYVATMTLSKNGGSATTYSSSHNNLYSYRGDICYPGSYSPWDSNTSYGYTINPPFAVTSGDSVTFRITNVNFNNEYNTAAFNSSSPSTTLKVKFMGTKTGSPNCPT